MKQPKFVLRIAGRQYIVPDSSGIATMIKVMAEALPVDADLFNKTIELQYMEPEESEILTILQEVRIQRIPAGIKWTRKTKCGRVEPVVFQPKAMKAPKLKALPPPKRKALPAPAKPRRGEMLQLEFGT